MDYIAHPVDTAAAVGSVADLLWAAADLVATNPETTDPIHDAGLHLIAAGRTTSRRGKAAVELATMLAESRHPDLAATIGGEGGRIGEDGPGLGEYRLPGSVESKARSPRDAGSPDRAAGSGSPPRRPRPDVCLFRT